MSKITIDEFICEEIDRIVGFKLFWLINSIDHIEMFPASLNPGEWDEQLRGFKDLKIDDSEDDAIKLLRMAYGEYKKITTYTYSITRKVLEEIQNLCPHCNIDKGRCIDCGKLLKGDL